MTEVDVLAWIDKNLGAAIQSACQGTMYEKALIAAITCRETGGLIAKIAPQAVSLNIICKLMTGDYTKRKHDDKIKYHGYGFMQIDVDAFPAFVGSGDWQRPDKLYPFAIKVLESKRHYIINHFDDLSHEELLGAIVAAYNAGEGNVVRAIQGGMDVDRFTAGHNYGKDVFRLRDLFKTKIENDGSF